MKILKFIFILACGLSIAQVQGQDIASNAELRLTPSPTAASLGKYGNTEVKHSTGGVYHNIELFEVFSGDIRYNPRVEYFSNGFVLDDWGGRLGMGWSDNFSGIIQREIRSVPDELATGYPLLTEATFTNQNLTNWQIMHDLEWGARNRSGLDAERDMFHFNIFGVSGSFIIKENECIQLNHQTKFRIQLLTSNPYTFCITDEKGVKYYFGSDGEAELTSYSNDNYCDQGGEPLFDIPTAWFLTKAVSPKGDELLFQYSDVNYTYMYDFQQEHHYKKGPDTTDIFPDPKDYPHHSYFFRTINCFREKLTKTKYLTQVTGKGWFVSFSYVNRIDLFNDKLLSNVSLHATGSGIKVQDYELEFDQVTSTVPIENMLNSVLGVSFSRIGLQTRYFLRSLKNTLNSSEYYFTYITPALLPHRFSFAQDITGYYNGLGGSGFIPADALDSVDVGGVRYSIPTGNRSSSINSQTGMLSKIRFPTGGSDSVLYEQNTYLKTEYQNQHQVDHQTFVNNVGYYEAFSSQVFTISGGQTFSVDIDSGYEDPEYPYDNDGSMHWVIFELWNVTDNIKVPLESNPYFERTTITMKLYENYAATLNLEVGKNYQFRGELYGLKTTLNIHSVNTTSTPMQVERPYYGIRVKNIITRPLNGPDINRKFIYKIFAQDGSKLIFGAPSSYIRGDINKYAWPAYYESGSVNGWENGWDDGMGHAFAGYYRYLRISSKGLYNLHVFNGHPIAYSHVTEVVGEESFIANRFWTEANNDGRKILSGENVKIYASNNGFMSGFPLDRYLGTVINNAYELKSAESWEYKIEDTVPTIDNFYVTWTYEPIHLTLTSHLISLRYRPYAVIHIPLFAKSYKLSSNQKWSYMEDGTVAEQLSYFYDNPAHLQPTRTEITKSNGSKEVVVTTYADDYPQGNAFIDAMKGANNHLIAHPIEEVRYKENGSDRSVLSGKVIKYLADGKGLVDQVLGLETQTPIPSSSFKFSNRSTGIVPPGGVGTGYLPDPRYKQEFQFISYDSYGNPIEVKKGEGPITVYLWGYNGRYPIAKIENATRSEVITALGGAPSATAVFDNLNTVDVSDAYINTTIQTLRATLKKSQVSTYTYTSLVGMTSMTDIRGITEHYKYDGFHRLENVLDFESNVLIDYKYHYKQ